MSSSVETKEFDVTPVKEILDKIDVTDNSLLIGVLQKIQDIYGYLPEKALNFVSKGMKIPMAKIYGVCTFYSQFKLTPRGKYIIMVCDGTACHVRGSQDILDELKLQLQINPGETTDDGLFSLEVVACIGACSLAPAMVIDEETYAKVTPKKVSEILKIYREKK